MTQISNEKFKFFWSFCSGRVKKIHPLSNHKGLRYMLLSMSMVLNTRNSNLGVNNCCDFAFDVLWHFIIKCDSYFIIIMRRFYYKMRQLIQNITILLQNAAVITKCYVYYKMCRYNHDRMHEIFDALSNSNYKIFTIKEKLFWEHGLLMI